MQNPDYSINIYLVMYGRAYEGGRWVNEKRIKLNIRQAIYVTNGGPLHPLQHTSLDRKRLFDPM